MSSKRKITDGYLSQFRLSVWGAVGGTLALRAKTWVCLNEIYQNKHYCAVHLPKN